MLSAISFNQTTILCLNIHLQLRAMLGAMLDGRSPGFVRGLKFTVDL